MVEIKDNKAGVVDNEVQINAGIVNGNELKVEKASFFGDKHKTEIQQQTVNNITNYIMQACNCNVKVTDDNIETLNHLVRKHLFTKSSNVLVLINKILKKYENGDVKISLAALRVIEFMDDELYDAIVESYNCIKTIDNLPILADSNNRETVKNYIAVLGVHNLVFVPQGRQGIYAQPYSVYHELHKLITENQ